MSFNHNAVNTATRESENNSKLAGALAVDRGCNTAALLIGLVLVLTKALKVFEENLASILEYLPHMCLGENWRVQNID